MSAFDDEVRQGLAEMHRDAGKLGAYHGSEASASGIYVVLDTGYEVYDQDQVAMRVTTISVLVADVATSRQGDTIALPGRTWTVQQTLEDDGFERRLWVS
ncbi:head-tail joining protein [Vreelandella sp. EE7]